MASGLTWANAGTDGGDLITAAATGGVPHPTGYPTYLLVAGLFQQLPLGTLAFRTNLLSAVAAVLASILVYATVAWLPDSPARGSQPAGLVAGFMFGLAPLVWSQAVITEVYTLHAFFVALVVLLVVWTPAFKKAAVWDGILGVILGLAVGSHLTSLFLVPAALVRGKGAKPWRLDVGALARRAAGLLSGLLVYLTLPMRALAIPPVNWGNPVSLGQFAWLVTGDLYQRRLFAIPVAGILQRLQEAGSLLARQFELPGILLALLGLVFFFKPSRLYFLTLWNAALFSAFAVAYGTADSYLYLIPVVLSASIWIGMGLGGLVNGVLPYHRILKPALIALLGVFLLLVAIDRWPDVDASQDGRAEQFGARVMAEAPDNAILLAEDDSSVFGLWYFHYALGQRPDLVVVASDLLHFEWYDDSLRATYPALAWPDDLFWPQTIAASNPDHPLCTIAWEQAEKIDCTGPE